MFKRAENRLFSSQFLLIFYLIVIVASFTYFMLYYESNLTGRVGGGGTGTGEGEGGVGVKSDNAPTDNPSGGSGFGGGGKPKPEMNNSVSTNETNQSVFSPQSNEPLRNIETELVSSEGLNEIAQEEPLDVIPKVCELAPICELISVCQARESAVNALQKKSVVGERVDVYLCHFADCDYTYFDYKSCTEKKELELTGAFSTKSNEIFSSEGEALVVPSSSKSKNVELSITESLSDREVARLNLQDGFLSIKIIGSESYCFDAKKNFDETGVDCGGSCKACVSESKGYFKQILTFWVMFFVLLIAFVFFNRRN